MRAIPLLAVAALLHAPLLARAENPDRERVNRRAPPAQRTAPAAAPRPAPGPAWSRQYPTAPAPAPAPAPGTMRPTPQYRTYPSGTTVYPLYPVQPYWWWGWGWGFGYYPLYPRPPVAEYGAPEPERVATTLSARASGARDGAAAGISLGIEGRHGGFDADIAAISTDKIGGTTALGSSSAIGWGTMHATWSIVSDGSARIRVEVGGSMLSMPTGGAAAGAPWESKVSFGPDAGISGQLGLVGPFGIEGHARVTPLPVPVTDLRAAVALRAGSLALTGGWRAIHVSGDGVDAPSIDFSGPEIGLALIF